MHEAQDDSSIFHSAIQYLGDDRFCFHLALIKAYFPSVFLKTDIFCTPCGTRVLQFYIGFFVAKLQKSKRIFYCISPENVSSMKPVASVVFRYCTSELAHAAAPPFQFEPATLGFGLVLSGCIFCVKQTHKRTPILIQSWSPFFLPKSP